MNKFVATNSVIPDRIKKRMMGRRVSPLAMGVNPLLLLKEIEERRGKFLSGGEKRRLELARLLVSSPRYVLLDEPFAGVDPISINEIKSHISSLASDNIGVLITDHNAADILDICDNVYVMKDGAIIFEGNPAAVAADETVKSVYLGH